MAEAKGFCTCKRDAPDQPHLHPPANATWHFLCDKPVLPPPLTAPERCPDCGHPTDAECDCHCCLGNLIAHITRCPVCWPIFAALGRVFDGIQ